MSNTFTFSLERLAKNNGQDRYTCEVDEGGSWTVYFPRYVTRPFEQQPAVQNVTMEVSDQFVPNSIQFKLTSAAKNLGGDKYTSQVDNSFNIYLLQSLSRKDGAPFENVYIRCSSTA
jgi:hypothetical protein